MRGYGRQEKIGLTIRSLPARACADAVIEAVSRRLSPAVMDSADTGPGRGRYTIVTCDPLEVAEWPTGGPDPFEEMRHRLERPEWLQANNRLGNSCELPFVGGWIGYFAYEAGRYIERLPTDARTDIPLPVARFALYDSAVIHDACTGRWTLVTVEMPCAPPGRRAADREAMWQQILAEARSTPLPAPPILAAERANMSLPDYLAMVQAARDYIADGDIFQVNLARRLTFSTTAKGIDLYRRLRSMNPGAYSAFISWRPGSQTGPETAVLSTSPELFLRLYNGNVLTRPIKGTRPRSMDPTVDAAWRMELAFSEKDRAELAMIIDLERNDLGRVCEFGSVRVLPPTDTLAAPFEVETHPSVHHLVGAVQGRLRPGRGAIDLMRACFPGGSITGAPKVRAMEIIDELEPTQRSVYTGAIGYFSLDGSMVFNIAIRTAILAEGRLCLSAGGGIVADSVPHEEYAETQAKLAGMCRALGIHEHAAPLTGELSLRC